MQSSFLTQNFCKKAAIQCIQFTQPAKEAPFLSFNPSIFLSLSLFLGVSFGCWVERERGHCGKGQKETRPGLRRVREAADQGLGTAPTAGAGDGIERIGRWRGPHGTGNDGWLSATCLRWPAMSDPATCAWTNMASTYSLGGALGLVRKRGKLECALRGGGVYNR